MIFYANVALAEAERVEKKLKAIGPAAPSYPSLVRKRDWWLELAVDAEKDKPC